MQKVTTWDHHAAALLKAACSSPTGLQRLFADPSSTAAELGFELDPAFESELQRLDPAVLLVTDSTTDQELSGFLHAAIVDGRYLQEWLTDPNDVARKLDLTVSPIVLERIKTMHAHFEQARCTDPLIMLLQANTVSTKGFASKGLEYRIVAPGDVERF